MAARSPCRHDRRYEKDPAALLETAGAMARQADDRRDGEQGRRMWPAAVFTPLERAGIEVTEGRFRNEAELNRAHPRAIRQA